MDVYASAVLLTACVLFVGTAWAVGLGIGRLVHARNWFLSQEFRTRRDTVREYGFIGMLSAWVSLMVLTLVALLVGGVL